MVFIAGKSKLSLFWLWLVAICLLVGQPVFAQLEDYTFGAEWEFMRHDLKPGPGGGLGGKEVEAAKEIAKYFRESYCPPGKCIVEEVKIKWEAGGEYKVRFPDGTFFVISYDPAVVEIQPQFGNMKFWEENAPLFQEAIFDQLKKLGYLPSSRSDDSTRNYKTAGHLNIGFKAMSKGDLAVFAQFYFDFLNHTELSFGALGRDDKNAPHPLDYKSQMREELKKIQYEILAGKISTVEAFEKAIHERVYTETTDKDFVGTHHYQAFNIQNLRSYLQWGIIKDLPFEIRPVEGQTSVKEFVLLAKYFSARFIFLKQNRIPLWYHASQAKPESRYETVSRFYISVVDAGLDWETYKVLMPDEFQQIPLSGFELGHLDPQARDTMRMIRRYLPDMINSPFVRRMILKIITTPEFLESKGSETILKELAEMYEKLKAEAQEVEKYRPEANVVQQSWATKMTKWIMTKLARSKPEAPSYLNSISRPDEVVLKFTSELMDHPNVRAWKRYQKLSRFPPSQLLQDIFNPLGAALRCQTLFQ